MVVDKPPDPPINSPNLETKKNLAYAISDKFVVFEATDKIPINIPLFEKLENVVNTSLWIFKIAVVKSA